VLVIDVNLDEEEKQEKNHRIELDLKQMQSIEKLSDFWSIEDFFQKKVVVNPLTGDVDLDLSYLSNFDDNTLRFIKKTESLNIKDNNDKIIVLVT